MCLFIVAVPFNEKITRNWHDEYVYGIGYFFFLAAKFSLNSIFFCRRTLFRILSKVVCFFLVLPLGVAEVFSFRGILCSDEVEDSSSKSNPDVSMLLQKIWIQKIKKTSQKNRVNKFQGKIGIKNYSDVLTLLPKNNSEN